MHFKSAKSQVFSDLQQALLGTYVPTKTSLKFEGWVDYIKSLSYWRLKLPWFTLVYVCKNLYWVFDFLRLLDILHAFLKKMVGAEVDFSKIVLVGYKLLEMIGEMFRKIVYFFPFTI